MPVSPEERKRSQLLKKTEVTAWLRFWKKKNFWRDLPLNINTHVLLFSLRWVVLKWRVCVVVDSLTCEFFFFFLTVEWQELCLRRHKRKDTGHKAHTGMRKQMCTNGTHRKKRQKSRNPQTHKKHYAIEKKKVRKEKDEAWNLAIKQRTMLRLSSCVRLCPVTGISGSRSSGCWVLQC